MSPVAGRSCGGTATSSRSPSRSSVVVNAVRSTAASYTLVSPINRSTCFVALPRQQITTPVANGSSVPAWPVFTFRRLPPSPREGPGPVPGADPGEGPPSAAPPVASSTPTANPRAAARRTCRTTSIELSPSGLSTTTSPLKLAAV